MGQLSKQMALGPAWERHDLVFPTEIGVGTRKELVGETDSQTRERLCLTFDKDDVLTPVAAYVATTLAPLI